MSLIHNKNLNYLTQVEQYFLSLKGSGLTLSAQDYHLIQTWEARAVPLERLLGVIEKTAVEMARQSGDRTPRLSLFLLRDMIEHELDQVPL